MGTKTTNRHGILGTSPKKSTPRSNAGYPSRTPGGSRNGTQSSEVDGSSNAMLSGTPNNRAGR